MTLLSFAVNLLVKNLLTVGQLNYHDLAPEFARIFYHFFLFSLLTGAILQFFWKIKAGSVKCVAAPLIVTAGCGTLIHR